MVQVGVNTFTITGDVGGSGISRQTFIRNDHGTIVSADANAASAAWRALWQVFHSEVPIAVTVSPTGTCEVFDDVSNGVLGSVPVTVLPSVVNGSSTSHYAAGNGVRINWNTTNVVNRRLVRGATFMVPLTVDAFAATGVVASVPLSGYVTAVANYLAAMVAASLNHAVHHRPKKGTFVGGVAASSFAATVSGRGAMLKSRRS